MHLVQHTVDAHPHEQRVFLRFEVDIARAVGRRPHDHRVDETYERRIGDTVVGFEVILDLVDDLEVVQRRLGLEHLGLTGATLELREDVVPARDAEVDLIASCKPQLVDPVDVRGIGKGDPKPVALAGDRDRDDPLQGAQRHELGRVGRDALFLQVDEGKAVPAGERASDALRLCVPLVAERLGERSRAGPPTRGREAVAWNEIRRSDQVGNEVGDRLEPGRAGGFSPALARPGAIAEVR